jgi:hypothetical protein
MIQRWTTGYAISSVLYFGLAWATILAFAIVILANFRIQNELLRYYAVVATCVTWIAGLIGIPDLARIPVRGWIRQLFGATQSDSSTFLRRRRRSLTLVLLAIVFLASTAEVRQILSSYRMQQRYSSLIREGLQTDDLRPVLTALALAPWRREAQVLVEKSAWLGRTQPDSEGGPFRLIAASLAANPTVEYAILHAPSRDHLPSYLDASSYRLNNPLVWYASIIIEGEGFHEETLVKEAITLLRQSEDQESALLLQTLVITHPTKDKDGGDLQYRQVTELEKQLSSAGLSETVRSTHTYLFACDALFGYHLAVCDKDAATKWFTLELTARELHRLNEDTLWLRPPEKFLAFYIFALYGDWRDGGVDLHGAGALRAAHLTHRSNCDYRAEFNKEIRPSYRQFEHIENWRKGTVLAQLSQINEYIESSLSKGWRY